MLKNKTQSSFYSRLLFYFLTFYILFGLGSALLVFEGYRENIRQVRSAHERWLKTYAETFFNDIALGNTIAVENRLNILVQRALAEDATLSFGKRQLRSSDTAAVNALPKDWLSGAILRFFPKNILHVQVTDTANTVWANLTVTLDPAMLYDPIVRSIKQFVFYGLSFFLIALALMLFFIDKLAMAVQTLADYIKTFSRKASSRSEIQSLLDDGPSLDIQELSLVSQEFQASVGNLLRLQEEMERHQTEIAVAGVARQVAHDIRSPLAALDSVTKDISQLPEEKRIIIRSAAGRIRDIANHLLEKNREAIAKTKGTGQGGPGLSAAEGPTVELLSSLLDPLITEKRMQFRARIGIEIEGRMDTEAYGIFAQVQAVEFKRVLSNLVNNSVEALGEKGLVTLRVFAKDDRAIIQVQDNGKGIPPEILGKLGQQGESHGKEGGSGLGLYHARTQVESWGGSLSIESALGQGTTITLSLPQCDAPEWFISRLCLKAGGCVVILDDDTSIHQIWQGRFDSLRVKERDIEVLHFSTPQELREFVQGEPLKARRALYLTDYELLGHRDTGLSLVEELGLGERAILITSRFEEKGILSECKRLKVRMIPKGLAGFVPIAIPVYQEIRGAQVAQDALDIQTPSVVLLDDDPLVRMNWKLTARLHGLSFCSFSEPVAFFEALKDWPKDIHIYLDSMLGEDIRGEEIAKTLHGQGYTNLSLATGYDADALPSMPWIKEVVGKEPPW